MRPRLPAYLVAAVVLPAAPLVAQTLASASAPPTSTPESANAPPAAGCNVAAPTRDRCITLFADGNVRGAVGDKEKNSVATGALGVTLSTRNSDFTGQVNVAAKADTVTGNFGGVLLTPGVGGALAAGLLDYRWHRGTSSSGFGYHAYGSVTSSRWATETGDDGKTTKTTDVAIIGAGALVSYEILRGRVSDNAIFSSLDAGIAYRGMFGDLATSTNDPIKRRLLGTTAEQYAGLEVGYALQVNHIKAGINYYFFFGPDAAGITDGQVVAGFSIQGNVFTGALK